MEICQRDWCDFVVWTPNELQITRLKRNKDAFNELLPYYTEVYAMFCRGQEPSRMQSQDKQDMNKRIKELIDEDIIDANPPQMPTDLQLYLSDEEKRHGRKRSSAWIQEAS